MPDTTTNPTQEDTIIDLDSIITAIELVETNSKAGSKNPRHKYIRLVLDNGKHLRWYPYSAFDRETVPILVKLLDESDK